MLLPLWQSDGLVEHKQVFASIGTSTNPKTTPVSIKAIGVDVEARMPPSATTFANRSYVFNAS